MQVSSHVFGPVPSRRLGRSLGVDLVPMKTCTYDCIYCQLGGTTNKTIERREWVPLDSVLREVEAYLSTSPDYITLSGSGEPTLHSRLGEVISGIKSLTDVPVAVLTNGSLLGHREVSEALLAADLVIPSLDAGDAKTFRHVNRPHRKVEFDSMIAGLLAFASEYDGQLWLEVLLLGGVTGMRKEVEKIAEIARRLSPDRVQLNTVTRPPAYDYAFPVSEDQLEAFARQFDGGAEVIADYRGTHQQAEFRARHADVLELLRRRPCTAEDIKDGLGLHPNEVVKYLEELTTRGKIGTEIVGQAVFYRARAPESERC